MDNFSQYKEIESRVNKAIELYTKNLNYTLFGVMAYNDELNFVGKNILTKAKKEGQSTQWYLEFELLGGEGHATNLYDIGWIKKDMDLDIVFTLNQDKGYINGDNDYYVPLECTIYLDDKLMDSNSVDIASYFATDEIYGYIKEYSLSDFE